MSENRTTDIVDTWEFQDISSSHFYLYPIFSARRLPVEDALEQYHKLALLSKEYGYFYPEPAKIYKIDEDILLECQKSLPEGFIQSDILRETSDLGLPYTLFAKYPNGVEFRYDGILIRITKKIASGPIDKQTLVEYHCYYDEDQYIADKFASNLHSLSNTKYLEYYLSKMDIFTFAKVNYKELRLKRTGPSQACIKILDPKTQNIERLRYLFVYFGEEDIIFQMLAHDIFLHSEIGRVSMFFSEKQDKLMYILGNMKDDFYGLQPIKHQGVLREILHKYRKWQEVNKTLWEIMNVFELIVLGEYYIQSLDHLVSNRLALYNWNISVSREISQFTECQIKDNKLVVSNQDQPCTVPLYERDLSSLCDKLRFIYKINKRVYSWERDILSTYQNEFALYAVIIAIFTLCITIFSILFLPNGL